MMFLKIQELALRLDHLLVRCGQERVSQRNRIADLDNKVRELSLKVDELQLKICLMEAGEYPQEMNLSTHSAISLYQSMAH
jgi:hypothetical protein